MPPVGLVLLVRGGCLAFPLRDTRPNVSDHHGIERLSSEQVKNPLRKGRLKYGGSSSKTAFEKFEKTQ
jgi:hypothetical protein